MCIFSRAKIILLCDFIKYTLYISYYPEVWFWKLHNHVIMIQDRYLHIGFFDYLCTLEKMWTDLAACNHFKKC